MVGAVTYGPVIVFCLLTSIYLIWEWNFPSAKYIPEKKFNFEDFVVASQMQRADNNLDAEILIVGDSSSLMGVNPTIVEKNLDTKLRVESLAAIASIYPSGFLKLVENYLKKNDPPQILIIQINPVTLSDQPEWFQQKHRRWVEHNFRQSQSSLFDYPKRKFKSQMSKVVEYPLPNKYGEFYGWPTNLSKFFHSNNGTLVDPGPKIDWDDQPHYFAINTHYTTQFLQAARIINAIESPNVFLIFTPNILSKNSAETALTRSFSYSYAVRLLGLQEEDSLLLPETMADEFFISTHHLNKAGREEFSKILAEALNDWLGRE
ncbi:hypothetical protein N9P87_01140 [bacterium]|nr:hypothetical protein [bacterium]